MILFPPPIWAGGSGQQLSFPHPEREWEGNG